jgi:hypothetical protein
VTGGAEAERERRLRLTFLSVGLEGALGCCDPIEYSFKGMGRRSRLSEADTRGGKLGNRRSFGPLICQERTGDFCLLEWAVYRRDAYPERVGKALELRPGLTGEFEGHRDVLRF